jgi:hypothetical protein
MPRVLLQVIWLWAHQTAQAELPSFHGQLRDYWFLLN